MATKSFQSFKHVYIIEYLSFFYPFNLSPGFPLTGIFPSLCFPLTGFSVSISSLFFLSLFFSFPVSFPRFIAPCNSAKMQFRIRWLFLFPCHLFVCFSSSIASLGPSLFFSSYLPSPFFVPCFFGFKTLSLLLFHYFVHFRCPFLTIFHCSFLFNVLLPLLIPLSVPVQFIFLFSSFFMTYHSVSFYSSRHWVGSVTGTKWALRAKPTIQSNFFLLVSPSPISITASCTPAFFPLYWWYYWQAKSKLSLFHFGKGHWLKAKRKVSWSTHVYTCSTAIVFCLIQFRGLGSKEYSFTHV